jgi:hypothetical protein
MNRTLFFAVLLCLSLAISAQNIPTVKSPQAGKMIRVEYRTSNETVTPFMNEINLVNNKGMISPNETELGETFYDLQSNSSINNRFQVWDDGTMAAVWTRGMEASSFTNRGTAYNYFNGSEWGPWPTVRLEDRRCGWPSIAAWGTGGEITVSHNGQVGLEWMQRETKGTGAWTQTNFLGPAGIENDITWPRMITSGENNEIIHLFVNSNAAFMGQTDALLYSRSNDGGETWDPHNIILDGMGSDDVLDMGADSYVLAAQGNTVVCLVGSSWHDLFYMRSDDNGENWEKYIVWEHPYPLFDWNTTITGEFFCPARNANVALGPDGKVHVVFGIGMVWHDEPGTSYWLDKTIDGIAYWNEDMDPFSGDTNALSPPQLEYPDTEMIEDLNYIGWMQDVDDDDTVTLNTDIMYYQQHGLSTVPSIGINEFGQIVVIYASTTETYEIDTWNYKHLWMRSYANGSWGDFTDLTGEISHVFDECYYPVIGKVSGQALHYIFNVDAYPGLAWDDDHAWQQNRIIYANYDLPVSIGENINPEKMAMDLSPNPATERVLVKFNLDDISDVQLTLTNMTGQTVREVNRAGMNGMVKIGVEVSDLPAGTYICTVKTDEEYVTQKLIVR